ncbi:Replication initiator protein A (plasmid) [Deinococcus proteolyticus MRP]|uniref:Replication initiator protein A n=1 Tax=Deinococcus proteolyticus (strain ATCC 35074 / DSM 20540 / JCM 6276 / NBRC 101906 / NCIMB 13154 / VKM Ac-1939 / CCM 2703 / MRP) TaxID=693977 RepID=F0RR77_DEIPM|nr:replication initiator protein A [Deinococcus proteolyticus]ADY27786.1 Replication initiator protein A [Deinococcus proteolyticus MRP]
MPLNEKTAATQIDELNLSQLNLISAVDKAENSEWEVSYEHGGRVVQIRCEALPKYSVPHGLDNDVSAALINLFMDSGMPEDGRFTISATALLRLCGWHNTGHYHATLKTSLERLHTSSYTVSGGWRDHPRGRWTHAKFHFIESLQFTTAGSGQFDERTVIKGRLADALIESLRGGYVKPLDSEFMLSLSRPRTRVLYRILDGARYDPENLEQYRDQYEVGLLAWAEQCRIPNSVPGNVRRALSGPHEELVERGYLRSVTISGRGKQQRIRYEFNENFIQVNPALLQRLQGYGIADGVARRLSNELGSAALHAHMDRFDWLVRTGVLVVKKSRAAALMHLIQHPDEYPYPLQAPEKAEKAPAKAKAARNPEPLLEPPSVAQEFAKLSVEEAAERGISRLGFHFRQDLSPLLLDQLRQAFLDGRLSPAAVLEDAMAAVARMKKAEFLEALREKLELRH